ncbi:MAG: penicillin-binding transpeptidase domain-containing protein [Bacillota bacterium]|nr:penicillin-binding transpeptidase domain-containing protein [Bacillota bacterium]
MKKRIGIIVGIILAIFFLLTIRTGFLTVLRGKDLSVMTDKQYKIYEPIGNLKYILQDRNGKEMLKYINKYYFAIDVDSYIKNNRGTELTKIKSLIYTLRNYNKDYDLTELKPNMTSKRIYYEVDLNTYNKLKDIEDVKGVYCFMKSEVDKSETWNYANILVSPADSNNKTKPSDSLEGFIMEKTSENKLPQITFDRDVNGLITEEKYVVPENNTNIRLTTDKDIENKIKDILKEDKWSKYEQVGAVLMEAETGKITAMVQKDDSKPNILLCSATENGFEPGSIFKTVVEETALETDKNLFDKKITCKEEKKSHGTLDMEEAYIKSCNTYFSEMGTILGFKNIYTMARKQGIFDKVLNFSGSYEAMGDILAPRSLDLKKTFGKDYDILRNIRLDDSPESMLGIGQSMRITPLQALNIVSTVVNNGTYVKPYIIDALVDNDGRELQKFGTTKTAAFKKSTAAVVKKNMTEVLKDPAGTGKQAYISGMECGGKTGTNTRFVQENGKIQKQSDGWFIGFVKYKGKYYTAVVYVQNIDVNGEGGGSTAAPVFKEVVNSVFQ